MLGLDVVLVESHTHVGGVDFDQFGKRVLKTPSNGDGTTNQRPVIG